MSEPSAIRRARGLAQRLALWSALCTAGSLVIFAAVAYFTVIIVERAEPDADTPEQIIAEARSEVGHAMLFAGPLAFVLAVGGTFLFTRRALRPLDQVIHSAASITPRELRQRLPVPEVEDEVRDVVLALNGLLGRLEHGFEALDRFALDASHELRTPLAVIGAELEVMLRSGRTVEEWEASAKTCLDEARRLTHLVEALLEMGRAERTRGELLGAVDVQQAIEHVLSASRQRAQARRVYLGGAPGDQAELLVKGEATGLQSALAGVVDNAIQYTPSGGEILVWCEASATAVTIHVDDDGPGVDAADAMRIFEPFMRGVVGRESSPGFGLGLAIAHRICERNGAHIAVSRSPRGGARFSITFPRTAAA